MWYNHTYLKEFLRELADIYRLSNMVFSTESSININYLEKFDLVRP